MPFPGHAFVSEPDSILGIGTPLTWILGTFPSL